MNNDLMFSSSYDRWATPQAFFDKLNEVFQFTLDAAADASNAKCPRYFTQEDDALQQEWTGVVWCNPPYGRELAAWMHKGYESSLRGATVVMLVPARTDTKWFHDYCVNGEITFLKGRLRFGAAKSGAPFPSMIVVFRPHVSHAVGGFTC